ncbi:bifunctional lysylphosphatidylglycerol synthetase/lysine--tRNA ligase LysX [Trueperella sp. LYQ141]|uniref:bifunctional lysylphosphatidylglycerol synthetase/lysine--tRNA ligase LysX n=1 Tax=Trueperella sp. LYQ141 TaxID=3391058 RepID=UPI003983D439
MIDRKKRIVAQILIWIFALATLTSLVALVMRKVVTYSPKLTFVERIFVSVNIPATASLVSFFTAAFLYLGLLHRKRLALFIVAAFQMFGIVSAISGIVFVLTMTENSFMPELVVMVGDIIVSLIFLGIIVWLADAFTARTRSTSWRRALVVFVVGLVVSLIITWILVHIFHCPGRFWKQFWAAISQGIGLDWPRHWLKGLPPIVPRVVSVTLGITVVLTVAVFLYSTRSPDQWNSRHEIEARRLLAKYGEDDSLGYVATRRDKLLHFSPSRRCAIAYQQFGNVCLASGDPIGDPDDWAAAIASWDAQAHKYGMTPGVLACSEAGAREYSKVVGYEVLKLGDEAIILPEAFRLDTPAMTDVRRAARRLRREGYTCQFRYQDDIPDSECEALAQAAEDWRHGEVERGFSMALGRLGDPSDPRVLIAQVNKDNGEPVAFMSFVPWGRRGISLDYMRRSAQAPNGANEYLVAELMAWGKNHGVTRVSLNFAFLRQVFAEAEEINASPLEKVNSRILGFFDRIWQLQRLYRSNAKYGPTWSPRYLALSSVLTVPTVCIAAGRAEGFLPDLFGRRENVDRVRLTEAEVEQVRALELPPPPNSDMFGEMTDQQRHRCAHARDLQECGVELNPVGQVNGMWLAEYESAENPCLANGLIGRVRSIRDHGGVCFVDLVDGQAQRQLVLESESVGREQLRMFARYADSGDIIRVDGVAGESRNGTASILVRSWQMLAKAYLPVPWDGLRDPQTRLRKRTMDMIVHPHQVELLRLRSKAIEAVRQTLLSEDYLEVETPILNTVHGGASARPFRTHINAYGMDLVARIAPELALKKLVIAGMDAVFEIGRNFRNEGADATHNPEFTVVEAYRRGSDYRDMRRLAQRLVQEAACAIYGRPVMPLSVDGSEQKELVDISGDWPVVSVCEAVSQAVGIEVSVNTDMDEMLRIAREHDIEVRPDWGQGAIIEELYGELVESHTVMPTFYVDFPAEISPLTAPHRTKPGLVERWDLVAGGMELGTAYSELTDPVEQRRRLVIQSWKAAGGDGDAMELDVDFLDAMALGMPPTGGLGIGLDRLVMALTDTNIRQVLAFPFVRPQNNN